MFLVCAPLQTLNLQDEIQIIRLEDAPQIAPFIPEKSKPLRGVSSGGLVFSRGEEIIKVFANYACTYFWYSLLLLLIFFFSHFVFDFPLSSFFLLRQVKAHHTVVVE